MNYADCLTYLQRLGNEVLTMKFGLETIRALLKHLGNPQLQFPSILIAGTNGKGSTARFIESICRESGLRPGLFTSPHLISIQERIRISGLEITAEDFARSFSIVIRAVKELDLPSHPTFFEMITATALNHFAEKNIDLGILEIGMGGRLDSTNATDPIISVITPISYDHEQYLGNSLSLIAAEKAGIMRPGIPVISAPQQEKVSRVLREKARKLGSHLHFIEKPAVSITRMNAFGSSFSFENGSYELGVAGDFQPINAALAIRVVQELCQQGFSLHLRSIQSGLHKARFPGVIQIIGTDPIIILDGSHNPAAIDALVTYLKGWTSGPRELVFGIMRDKAVGPVIEKLSGLFTNIYLTQTDPLRSVTAIELKKFIPAGIAVEEPEVAYARAVSSGSTVVVAGSLHLVGAVLKSIETRNDSRSQSLIP